jgi:ERCC4-related helicase
VTLEPGTSVRSMSGAFPGVAEVLVVRPGATGSTATVELPGGETRKVDAADLVPVLSLEEALVAGTLDPPERWLLRCTALAVVSEQQRTGMAGTLRLTPHPHQVLAAHHAVDGTSGRVLLADDVGMGKTIEVGLSLAVLMARNEAKRVLILCPAGIRRQWRSELEDLFGMSFDIVGADGDVSAKGRNVWLRYERVIASLDLLRREDHRERLAESPPWDLVIVDEAHRVTAREAGGFSRPARDAGVTEKSPVYRSQTYQLVDMLSQQTRRLIFATATPHQGRDDQFLYLLRLLRRDLVTDADCMSSQGLERVRPRLAELLVRTPKRLAADWEGRRIFRGSIARTVRVPVPADDAAFRDELLTYIELGYQAADRARLESSSAVLINFVMTTFLKLWASSRAAIGKALANRRDRLEVAKARRLKAAGTTASLANEVLDAEEGEEQEETIERITGTEFFDDEIRMLGSLLERLKGLGPDPKVDQLVHELDALRAETGSGVLIFTEYLNSQKCIVEALRQRFGSSSVEQIRGGHGAENQAASMAFQAGQVPYLVSTQAGGEGLNLQKGGSVLVNFDQPWNPMRTLQRIGRLDRFGQANRVLVVNLVRESDIDDRIQIKTWEKLQRATAAIAATQGANPEDLAEAVVGEFVEKLDLRALLRLSLRPENQGQAERMVDEVLDRVRTATSRAESLFRGLDAFQLGDPRKHVPPDLSGSIRSLVEGVLKAHRRRLDENADGTYRFKLPEDWRGERGMEKEYVAVAFDARTAEAAPSATVMGFGVPVFDRMIEWARADASPARVSAFRATGSRLASGTVAIFTGRLTLNKGGREFKQARTWEISVDATGAPLEYDRESVAGTPPGALPAPMEVRRCLSNARRIADERLRDWVAGSVGSESPVADLILEALAWVEVEARRAAQRS